MYLIIFGGIFVGNPAGGVGVAVVTAVRVDVTGVPLLVVVTV
jgi:hypothetical protein